ncbi:MAG: DsbA family protein [Thermomicrobiales bacterium]|nr:DsbA family protein [Thermomicrobiales bacterium]
MSSNTPKRRSSKGKSRPQTTEGTDATSRAQSRRAQRVIQAEKDRKRRRMMILGGGALVAVLVILGLVLVNTLRDNGIDDPIVIPTGIDDVFTPGPEQGAIASPEAGADGTPVSSQHDGSQILAIGDPNAPVTIQEWADYQCPICAQWSMNEEAKLVEQYVNTGQVYVEFRNFPFIDRFFASGAGRESVRAAEAVACSMDQGAGYRMHKTIFANHNGENEGAFTQSRLEEMANQLGLDTTAFVSCLEDDTYLDVVRASYDEAINLGVNSTPTFFINGEQVTGYQTFEQLQQRIDAELSK